MIDRFAIKLPRLKKYQYARRTFNFGGIEALDAISDIQCSKACERLAQYFRREERYDFPQYIHAGDFGMDKDTKAFVFVHQDLFNFVAYGAVVFRYRKFSNYKNAWALQWIWTHPYFRGKGHLEKMWPSFQKICSGFFYVEGPYSKAMSSFLSKINYENEVKKMIIKDQQSCLLT